MVSFNGIAQSGSNSGRIGCLLDKAFRYNGLTVERDGASGIHESVMRPISPPRLGRYEDFQILPIPVSKSHFSGKCTSDKRLDCPLLVGHRSLISERNELAFSFYDSVMSGYKAWFMQSWVDGVAKVMETCRCASEKGVWDDDGSIIDHIMWRIDDGCETNKAMRFLHDGLQQMIGTDLSESDEYAQRWISCLTIGRQIAHDSGIIIAASVLNLDMAKRFLDRGMFSRAYSLLSSYMDGSPNNFASLVKLIIAFESFDAERKGVGIEVGHLPELEIANSVRLQLLCAVNELLLNAIKYSDPEKQSRVWIDADLSDDGWFVLSIEDNGVGIKDVESATNVGYRERPDLALGDGFGLASVKGVAESCGWKLSFSSKVGQGTGVTLAIKVSGASEIISAVPVQQHLSKGSVLPQSNAVDIPPPPPLPREFVDIDFSRVRYPVHQITSHASTVAMGGGYLYLSIPAPVALCG